MHTVLEIDGSAGEGGGQILRTALTLSAITCRPFRLMNVRARRAKPGLAAQHLTAVRAAAKICGARLAGDALGSLELLFSPQDAVKPGHYAFDVAEARPGGSAGAVTLVLQCILLPLALARGRSTVAVIGGTHLPGSPPSDYVRDVWLPALGRMGIKSELTIARLGWYPVGQGEIQAVVTGRAGARLTPLVAVERGALASVRGRAVASRLPDHVPRRMAEHARAVLADAGIASRIAWETADAVNPGTGIFITAETDNIPAGFSAFGKRGKPSEQVAEEAVNEVLSYLASGACLDRHLGDQILLPAAFASGASTFTVERITAHLTTNAQVIERFGLARVEISGLPDQPGRVTVRPQ